MRYTFSVQHGEINSVFYVVDSEAHEDEQPAVTESCFSREDAIECARRLNGEHAMSLALEELNSHNVICIRHAKADARTRKR